MSSTIPTAVRAFMARAFATQKFGDDDDIFALGFGNSLFAMQLVTFVEDEFEIEIEPEDLEMENFRSVNAVAALVESKQLRRSA